MKKSLVLALGCGMSLVLLGLLTGDALSQGGAPAATAPASGAPAGGYIVGAIDISKILKNHIRFKQMMDQMKQDVDGAEATLNKEREQIARYEEQIKQVRPGTPDFKKMDEELLKLKNDFNMKATLKKKELMDRETSIYYTIFMEISSEVKMCAEYYQFHMVIRYNSDVVDSSSRESVYRELNKPVLYIRPGLDITEAILKSLNDRYARTATAPAGPQGPTKRPN